MQDLRKLVNKYSLQLKQGVGEPDFNYLMRLVQIKKEELPRLGYAHDPQDEAVRLGQMPFLHFPPTSIASINESHLHGEELLVLVYFFGLLGTNGPLPLATTNYVYQRSINKYDSSTRRFLDLINHRLLSLYFRAFAHNEQSISFDRRGGDFSKVILSLAGIAKENFTKLPHHSIHALVRFFSLKEKSLDGLNQALRAFFDIKIKVLDFNFSKQVIPHDLRFKLGDRQTSVLGLNAQIGSHYFSRTKSLRIIVGPLSFEQSYSFMPGQPRFVQLQTIINLYSKAPVDLEIELLIQNDGIKSGMLNGKFALGQSLHLVNKKALKNQVKVVKIKVPKRAQKYG